MVVDQEELDSLREKERLEKIEKEWKSESQAIQRYLPRPFEINSQVYRVKSLVSIIYRVMFISSGLPKCSNVRCCSKPDHETTSTGG